jgi:hypothetical protein
MRIYAYISGISVRNFLCQIVSPMPFTRLFVKFPKYKLPTLLNLKWAINHLQNQT